MADLIVNMRQVEIRGSSLQRTLDINGGKNTPVGILVVISLCAELAGRYQTDLDDAFEYIMSSVDGQALFKKFVKEEHNLNVEYWQWVTETDYGDGPRPKLLGGGWILKDSPELTKLILEYTANA